MNATQAVQFLAHEAKLCRDRDAHEALCLLLPAFCRLLNVRALDDVSALEFQRAFQAELRALNAAPLVEAHCECCQWPDTISVRHFGQASGLAKSWCDQCGAERFFLRNEVHA